MHQKLINVAAPIAAGLTVIGAAISFGMFYKSWEIKIYSMESQIYDLESQIKKQTDVCSREREEIDVLRKQVHGIVDKLNR